AKERQLANLKCQPATTVVPTWGQRQEHGKSERLAAASVGVGHTQIYRAEQVLKRGDQSLISAVERGDIPVGSAFYLVDRPKSKQAAIVAEGPKAVKAKITEKRARRSTGTDAKPPRPTIGRRGGFSAARAAAGELTEMPRLRGRRSGPEARGSVFSAR